MGGDGGGGKITNTPSLGQEVMEIDGKGTLAGIRKGKARRVSGDWFDHWFRHSLEVVAVTPPVAVIAFEHHAELLDRHLIQWNGRAIRGIGAKRSCKKQEWNNPEARSHAVRGFRSAP